MSDRERRWSLPLEALSISLSLSLPLFLGPLSSSLVICIVPLGEPKSDKQFLQEKVAGWIELFPLVTKTKQTVLF